jgi:predicted unusual protein kinase regulating ubiquinone biosynthesis (AarF/ABC1/UbiB family)
MENAPTGRLGRMARLAALGLKTGAGMALGREQAVADRAAEVLGNLRGLAAKVGQMASYVDGIVPEGKRDAFEASLKVLRAQAPRSKPEAIRALVEEELGAPIDQLFDEWVDEPMASASIGQVHHARIGERRLAVKVQHPGIQKAVESDLANAGVLEGLAALGGNRRFDTKGQLEAIRQRFREELDYVLEAERIVHFGKVHAGDPTVKIPELVAERSSGRVLTTELMHGIGFEEALEKSEGERRAWAETMWRYVFKGNLVGEMFNADPHPGNYLFQEDGKVAFLDYGCIQPIDPERLACARIVHRAALANDEKTFFAGVSRMVNAKPGKLEDLAQEYTRVCFEPLFESPYTITRPYAARLVDGFKEMALLARKTPDEELFTMPPDMLFINRLQFGFYSVLARLDVEVDYASVERAFLP